jgi:small subunit ribosomal protein S3
MMEKKFFDLKAQELEVKEYIKKNYDYVSSVKLEKIPIGEKIIIRTVKPYLIGGKRGEGIDQLAETLKKKFGLENPQIEIQVINNLFLDAQSVAEYIKKSIEHFGPLSFKVIAYKVLEKIREAGAIGAEIRLSGKLPSEKAKSWRFSFGSFCKSGNYKEELVDYAEAQAQTIPGIVGIKVLILRPDVILPDQLAHKLEKEREKEKEKEMPQESQEGK